VARRLATALLGRPYAAGRGRLGDLLDAMTRGTNVARTEARLRVSGPDRYRLDFSRRPRCIDSTTIACDGERRWRVFQDRILVGPAAPLGTTSRFWPTRAGCSAVGYPVARSSPTVAGPRQLGVTPVPGDAEVAPGPLMTFTTDAIVDAETGCLLRLISYSGDTLVIWSELDNISTDPADPDEFLVHVPPGTRTVEETGNLIADTAAVMPGVKGTAARAAEAVNRTVGAVSAARSFLDDLRGHR
jgi:hypothetical protein